MESWLTVVLCVAVACHVHAHPKSSEEVQEDVFIKPSPKVPTIQKTPSDGILIKRSSDDLLEAAPDGEVKKAPEIEKSKMKTVVPEKMEAKDLTLEKEDKTKVSLSSSGAKIKVRFPEESKKDTPIKEDDEIMRSKKSPSMREMTYNGPHTTTVCIQVRADQHQKVLCGPQVNQEEKEASPTPSARFAYQSAPNEGYPMQFTPQRQFVRFSTQEPTSGRATGQTPQQMMVRPMPKFVQQGPSPMMNNPPGAARGPMMFTARSVDEELPKQVEQVQPPLRIIPQGPPPNSVVVHKQYFQAVPVQQSLIAPSPLRLNCALQPEGAQFMPTYPTTVLRSANPTLPGLYPIGEQMIVQDSQDGRMPQGGLRPMEGQGYYFDTQARQAQQDQIIGSPYSPDYMGDPWIGSTFVGEDGQTYLMNGRSTEDQLQMLEEQQFPGSKGTSQSNFNSMSMDELKTTTYQQAQELKDSKHRLQQLQQKLKDIEARAKVDESEKKDVKKDSANADLPKDIPSEPTPEPHEPKKPHSSKSPKRQNQKSI